MAEASFAVGSLVRARGREWVVLPESEPEKQVLMLRPLGGTDDEVAGIYLPLEPVTSAEFPLPDPDKDLGSHESCLLLREAVRLGFRSAAGPFRSLGRIAVSPRPYQLVPLLMALRQDPVRMLIADDVGIGKTVEALLIARELLDRGEIQRIAVITPPALAEQWQRAMRDQFHLDATLVLPSTASRLERGLGPGESLFEQHPFTVVSMDWVKTDRRHLEFQRVCPELVIVDEAHTCSSGGVGRAAQQRHDLLKTLSANAQRHMVLVTATPHSGNEENFRSLLTLLDPDLGSLPSDLSGDANRAHRERLARYLVQRRRDNLRAYLDTDTPFPERIIAEESYGLSKDYRAFVQKVLAWCREQVFDKELDARRQRVRWWSALALLRSLSSSPAAAAATLRNRAASASTDTIEEADAIGRHVVLDQSLDSAESTDIVPGSEEPEDVEHPERRKLLRLAKQAEGLRGTPDKKLEKATEIVKQILKDGWSPILFCRFIPTVEYVAEHLRRVLPKDVVVEAITGLLPPEEREVRVDATAEADKKVLVCTDCLSEGVNLQHGFDTVLHYDLPWNPTRLEQREGRVDRFGQVRPQVRAVTFFGKDNPVDGIVLQVLLRKHKAIHDQLGIVVPIPMDTDTVVEAIFEGLMMRGDEAAAEQLTFDFVEPQRKQVELQWEAAVAREKKSRSLFAQSSIKVEEVAVELAAAQEALGDDRAVETFVTRALSGYGVPLSKKVPIKASLAGTPAALRDALEVEGEVKLLFSGAGAPAGVLMLTRTSPFVAGLAAHVLEAALDPALPGPARRCGVVQTTLVERRTTLVLMRLRFHIVTRDPKSRERELLAEDLLAIAFAGTPEDPKWLAPEDVEKLMGATPSANVADDLKRHHLSRALERMESLRPALHDHVHRHGEKLIEAHRRVRKAGNLALRSLRIEPHLPADILGLFVYLPEVAS